MNLPVKLQRYYLNSVFYLLVILYTLIITPLSTLVLVVLRPFASHRQAMKNFRLAIRLYGCAVIRVLPWPLIKINFIDKAQTDNPRGPFIYVCNHRSASDPFLMALLPHELVQVVNIWPFRIPILGVVAKGAGYLSVREMPFDKFQAEATRLLNDGVSIVVFPEGTRSGSGEMGSFHSAIFRVALSAGYSIVPVCITGNETIPTREFVLNPGTITVHKLPAVPWETFKNEKPFTLKNQIRKIIDEELTQMENLA
jgi:1-acyl-sn-glycerol-3-phosphate acyltransferase